MNPAEEIPPEHAHRAYYRQPVWKRIVVIAAGPAVNIVLAFVILPGVFMAQGTVSPPPVVGAIEQNTPAATALKPGDALLAVDGKPLTRQLHRAARPGRQGRRRPQGHAGRRSPSGATAASRP